eukprot:TRINITY_DN6644_c0_g1_i1.p1 TRINITY_DN6644_c0_g1~~TRINITY_DN6644_c0_g1_i1.p1  ORF type:complete len:120 (-),score=17.72 TRINITY_DN6644_c0_g1_i1:290-610(-)
MLLDRGADVNQARDDGSTPLWIACSTGHAKTVAMLLDRGADVNQSDGRGNTPLHVAIEFEQVSILLVDRGADANKPNAAGQTPLDLAVSRGFDEVAVLLQGVGVTK